MVLRECTYNDCDLIFNWANDKAVRKNAFNTEQIKYKVHIKWFNDSLKSSERKIFICEDEGRHLGQIRIDIEGTTAVISYMVDEKFRGLGIGTKMVNLIEGILKNQYPQILYVKALVKNDNIASRKVFTNNFYVENEEEGYMIYLKKLGVE